MSEDRIIKKVLSDKITLHYREKSPYINYYFRLYGKTFRGSTFSKNEDESEMFSVLKYNEVKKNKGQSRKKISFRECVNSFFEYKKRILKTTTLKTYQIHSRFLLEYYKNIDPNTIDFNSFLDYEKWRREYFFVNPEKNIIKYIRDNQEVEMRKDPHSVGDVLINREIGLLRNILRYCSEKKSLISMKKIPVWEKYDEGKREGYFEEDDCKKLQEYFMRKNPYYWSICSFLRNTGLRYPSELNELKWKDIHFEQSFMVVRNRKGRKKSDEPMSVPIVGESKRILNKLKSRNVPTGPENYVFVDDKNNRILNITRSLKKSLQELKIEKKLSMYSWRHTYATEIILKNPDIPLIILSKSMGHSDVRMIDKHYGFLRPENVVKYFQQSEDKKQREIEKENQTEQPST